MNERTSYTQRIARLGAFLVLATLVPTTAVTADNGCDQANLQALDADASANALGECATTAWDPDSTLSCLPEFYGGSEEGESFGGGCGSGGPAQFDSNAPKCGYGWAQKWAVEVELSQGDARVYGHVTCDGAKQADCTIQIGGVKVCHADGGSRRGPIVCGGTIEEIAEAPVEGVVKCTDPLNPLAVIVKTFEILSLDSPFEIE